MRSTCIIVSLAVSCVGSAIAQEGPARHEVGFTLGGLLTSERRGATRAGLESGVALQANYGYRLFSADKVAIYGEGHLLASPLREVTAADQSLTRNVATLFVTPGIRVKLFPARGVAPYFAVGGGWADYEQSTRTLSGRSNPASRVVNHAALDYGGGVDVRFWRFVGVRAEIRDFYAGGPSYNTSAIRGGQHNVVAGGGFVLEFARR